MTSSRALVPLAALLLLSCGNGAASHRAEPVVAPTRSSLDLLRTSRTFGAHLVASTDAIASREGRLSIAHPIAAWSADLPAHAAAPIHLARSGDAASWAEIAPLGLTDVPGSLEGNAIVFSGAAGGDDVIELVEAGSVEEVRVATRADRPIVATYRVTAGSAIADVIADGSAIAMVDAAGRRIFGAAPLFAEDAHGARRALVVSITKGASDWTIVARLDPTGMAAPIAIDPAWSPVAPLATPRAGALAVLLPTGKVLVAGGRGTGNVTLSTSEVYDPVANTWTNAGTFSSAIASGSSLVALPNGRAFLVDANVSPGHAYLWDGAANTWQTVGSSPQPRTLGTLVALADSRILFAGGENGGTILGTAHIYDPKTNIWSSAGGSMNVPRDAAAGTLLADGRVLLVGGETAFQATSSSAVEIYDPKTGLFTNAASLSTARALPLVARLPDGRVLVTGGQALGSADAPDVKSTEIFDPATGTFTPSGNLISTFDARWISALTSGDVVVGDNPFARWSAASGTWSFAGDLGVPRRNGALVGIANDRALWIGGSSGTGASLVAFNNVDLYQRFSNGQACDGPEACVSGACVDGVCCATSSCAPGSSCATTAHAGTCAKVQGQTCAADAECGTGHCVDGVCCNTACGSTCQACDVIGSTGTCTTIAGAPHGTRTPCSDGAGNVCAATTCNGTDATACHLPAAGTVTCGSASCSSGVEHHPSKCTASGTCGDTPLSCGVYACGATACKKTCATSDDCAPGYYCPAGTSSCVPVLGLGAPCTDPKSCTSGLSCVDGVCCASASCPGQSTCAAPGKEGRCTRSRGGSCAVDDECGTGHCVDGVCCESTCDGQCQACDVPGSLGLCAPIVGAPHGARPACASSSADACAASSCDGVDTATCKGFVGSSVTCRVASCTGGVASAAAVCDGKGSCPAAVTTACGDFLCGATACRTSCVDDGDCVPTATCVSGLCKPRTATCSADGTSVVSLDGSTTTSCAPFACRAGACLTSCGTSNDCATGANCSFETKTCVAEGTNDGGGGGGSGGGCSTAPVGGGKGVAWIALAALGSVWMILRRRAAAVASAVALASVACARGSTDATPSERPSAKKDVLAIVRETRALPVLAHFGAGSLETTKTKVAIPMRSSAPLHVEDPRAADVWVDVSMEGVDIAAEVSEGATIFREIAPSTSVLYAHDAREVEEVRVLHDAKAPRAWRYRITAGPAIAYVRLREGRIEAVDAHGVSRLATAPIVAADAAGRDVPIAASLERIDNGARVTVAIANDDDAYPIVVDPAWSAGPAMNATHDLGVFVTLPDGRIFAAGGADVNSVPQSSAEVFDPKTRTWSATKSMTTPRGGAAAALVGGKVLVTGGFDAAGNSMSTAESWDPTSGTWSAAPSLTIARSQHGMVATPTGALAFMGRNIVAGVNGYATTAEAFDGTSWKTTATSPSEWRLDYGVATSGTKIVLAGGVDEQLSAADVAVVDVYDTTTKAWSVAPSLPTARSAMGVIVATNGDVWFIGGGISSSTSATSLATVDVFTPSTSKWSTGPVLATPRRNLAAVKLVGGRYLVAGGWTTGGKVLASAEIFDPSLGGGWGSAGSLTQRLTLTAPFALADGGAALIGGYDFDYTTRTELYEPFANGVACSNNTDCASQHCVDFVCCGSASCPSGQSCASPTKPGTCAPVNGVACASDASCGSGHCVDGVCCDSTCTDECAACDVGGHVGKCTAVVGAPHGSRAACPSGDPSCGPTCNGTDTTTCHPATSGTVCGSAACSAGIVTTVSTCDGAGTCIDTSQSCGAFACATTACKTSCASSVDCAQGYRCAANVCVPLAGKGTPCADGSTCGAGLFCTDGVCCSVAACDADSTCNAPASAGDCVKERGASCTADAECGSKSCADGHCCDVPCQGTCEACDLPGRVGTCAPVLGAPHGTRACASSGGDVCAAATCDGTTRTNCSAFASSDVSCRAAGCVNGVLTSPANCDGAGHCPAAVTTDCQGYACDAAGVACRTACETNAECASDYQCSGGKCIRLAGTCSSDGTAVVASDNGTTSCAPFLCRGGACLTTCTTSDDCAAGASCDPSSGACANAPSGGGSSGGCAIGDASTSDPFAVFGGAIFALALLGAYRRRK